MILQKKLTITFTYHYSKNKFNKIVGFIFIAVYNYMHLYKKTGIDDETINGTPKTDL